MGSSKKQTVGYEYYLGIHMVLCHSGIDQIVDIYVDDRNIWNHEDPHPEPSIHNLFGLLDWDERAANSGVGVEPIFVDKRDLFGGRESQGGIQGKLDLMYGAPTQGYNTYLANQLGEENISCYRGVVSLVANQMYIGNNPYLKPWAIMVKANQRDGDGNDIWYKAKAAVNTWDLNGAHCIYQAITNKEWGLALPASEIDETSLMAVADTLYDEGMGLSFVVNSEGSVEDFIGEVLSHIDGALVQDKDTGLLKVKLIRDDYDPLSLPLLGPGQIRRVKNYERTQLSDLVNTITVKYWDRELRETSTYKIEDLAAIQVQGTIIEKTVQYNGVTNIDLAAKLAARDLRSFSAPLIAMDIEVDRTAGQFEVSDPVRIQWPQHGIEDIVFRIVRIKAPKFGSGAYTLSVMQDVFGVSDAIYSPIRPDNPGGVYDPVKLDPTYAEEAPYALLKLELDPADFDAIGVGEGAVAGIGHSSANQMYGFRLDSRSGSVVGESDLTEFTPYATLSSACTKLSGTMVLDFGISDTEQYQGLAVVNGEYIEIGQADENPNARVVKRGCFDTEPAGHPEGSIVWLLLLGDAAIDTQRYYEGEVVEVRHLGLAPLGTLAPEDADPWFIPIESRAARPYPPANVRIDGSYWPAEINHANPFSVNWNGRDKVTQAENAVDWFTASGTGPAGVTFNVRTYDNSSNQLVEEYTGLTQLQQTVNPLRNQVRIEVEAVVDGVTSRVFSHVLTLTAVESSGYGYNYGNDYGGS